jgi:hypothetical protein
MAQVDAIITAVLEMVHAVNRGDFATAIAAFSDTPLIVEDIAPFRWQGAGAASEWLSAMGSKCCAAERYGGAHEG